MILKQLSDAYAFLERSSRYRTEYEGLERVDYHDVPPVALREALANVLFRLGVIETYGTGIGRMRSSYADSGRKPDIRLTPNTFTVFLPNRNAPDSSAPAEEGQTVRRLLGLLEGGSRPRREIRRSLGMSQSSTIRLLAELVERGLVEKRGAGKSTLYTRAKTR